MWVLQLIFIDYFGGMLFERLPFFFFFFSYRRHKINVFPGRKKKIHRYQSASMLYTSKSAQNTVGFAMSHYEHRRRFCTVKTKLAVRHRTRERLRCAEVYQSHHYLKKPERDLTIGQSEPNSRNEWQNSCNHTRG